MPEPEAARLELAHERVMAVGAERMAVWESIAGDSFAHDDEHRCHNRRA